MSRQSRALAQRCTEPRAAVATTQTRPELWRAAQSLSAGRACAGCIACPDSSRTPELPARPSQTPSTERELRKEVPRDVKEDRRSEAERVDAVEDAGVAADERAVVLNVAVPLDARHRHAAREAGQGHHGGDRPGPVAERR